MPQERQILDRQREHFCPSLSCSLGTDLTLYFAVSLMVDVDQFEIPQVPFAEIVTALEGKNRCFFQ